MVPQNESFQVWQGFPATMKNSFAFEKEKEHNAPRQIKTVGKVKLNSNKKIKAGGGTTSLVGLPTSVPTFLNVVPTLSHRPAHLGWAK